MSLFPRFVDNDFAPMFRLMDDYANHVLTSGRPNAGSSALSTSLRSFQPKFDLKENKDSFELHGELPGVESKDVTIEFSDPQTLTIKGRTENHREEGERPAGFIEGDDGKNRIVEGGESISYHKATVEDDAAMSGANPEAAKSTEISKTTKGPQQVAQPKSRYWVSERSVGEFSRVFQFPTRVSQDDVKASMKNGILSIVVPKAAPPVSKRINIE